MGELPEGLKHVVEAEFPVDSSRLHAVCAPAKDRSLVICAIEREVLQAQLKATPDLLSIKPQSLPPFLEGSADPTDFNLLVGSFEPRTNVKRRCLLHCVAAAMVLLAAIAGSIGFARRAIAHRIEASAWKKADLESRTIRGELLTANELRLQGDKARIIEAALENRNAGFDAVVMLTTLLASLPATESHALHSVSVAESDAWVRVHSKDSADFLDGVTPIDGWLQQAPSVVARAEGFDIEVRWTRRRAE
jgi:hypothetical protein